MNVFTIFNANGIKWKVGRSKLQDKLNMASIPEPLVYTSIVNMGVIYTFPLQPLKKERKVMVPSKHEEIC